MIFRITDEEQELLSDGLYSELHYLQYDPKGNAQKIARIEILIEKLWSLEDE